MDQEKVSDRQLIVDWDGLDDPGHPQNLSKAMKWFVTLTYELMTFVVTFASSVFSTTNQATSAEFHVSTEVMTLATALTVLVRFAILIALDLVEGSNLLTDIAGLCIWPIAFWAFVRAVRP